MSGLGRTARVLLVVYLLLAVAEQIAGASDRRGPDAVLTVLLMPVLAGFVLAARSGAGRSTTLAIVALGFSWLGDTVGGIALLAKIGLFLIAQLLYIAAFWPDRGRSVLRRPPLLSGYLVLLAAAVTVGARLSGELLPAVGVYGCALAVMALLATGPNRWTAVGGFVFVVSDLSLSVAIFGAPRPAQLLDPVVMPTYLVAQLLLAWGLVRAQARSRTDPAPIDVRPVPAADR